MEKSVALRRRLFARDRRLGRAESGAGLSAICCCSQAAL